MKATQKPNPNIILLNEDYKVVGKLVIDQWGTEPTGNLKGTYGRLTEDSKLWFDKYTIKANADDTVFVFGANIGHFQNRTDHTRNSGQAHKNAVGDNSNTFPINTMNNNGPAEKKYMKKAEAILTKFVEAGGKVVFPVNNNGSTVGTGIAQGNLSGTLGKEYAEALAKELQNIQGVGNADPEHVKTAMDNYIAEMNALENQYKQAKPGKKENNKSKEVGIGVKMQKKIKVDHGRMLYDYELRIYLDQEESERLKNENDENEKQKQRNTLILSLDKPEVIDRNKETIKIINYIKSITEHKDLNTVISVCRAKDNDSDPLIGPNTQFNGTVKQKKEKLIKALGDPRNTTLSGEVLMNKELAKLFDSAQSDPNKKATTRPVQDVFIINPVERGLLSNNQQIEGVQNQGYHYVAIKLDRNKKTVQVLDSLYKNEESEKILNNINLAFDDSEKYKLADNKQPPWTLLQHGNDCGLCAVINSYFLKNPDKTECVINNPDDEGTPWIMRFELNNPDQNQATGMNCYISYNKKRDNQGNETEEEDWEKVEMPNNVLPPEASDLLRSAIMEEYRGLDGDDLESVVTIESDYTGGGDGDDEFSDGIYHPDDGLGEGAGNLDIDADFTKLPNIDGVTKWANKRAFYHKEILKPKKFQIGAYFKSLPKTATQGKVAQYLSIIALPITATLSGISGLIGGGFFNPIYIASSHDAWTGIPDYNTASPDFDGNKLEIQRCVTGVLELLDTGCHSKKIEELKHSNPPIKIETQEALGNMVNLLAYKSSEHNLELAMRHSTDDSEKNKLIAYKNIMTKIMTEKKWTMGSSGDFKDFNPKDMRNLVNVISGGDDKHPLMDLINKIENASDQRITKKLKEKFTHMVLHYSNSYSNSLATKYGINNQTVSISDMAYNAGFNLDLIIPRLKSMSMDPAVSQYINPDSLNLLKDYIKSDKRCQRAQRIAQDIHTSVDDKTAIDGVKGKLDGKIKACDNRVKFLQTQINGVKPEVQSMIDKINHKKESLKQSKEKLDIIETKDGLQQWFIGYSEDIANQRYNYKANEKKPQLKGVKSLEIKAKVYEDGKSYEEKEQKAIKAENDRREIITSYRFIEDANILDNGDIKDVGKAAIELNNFINICEEELKKIPKDNDSADHAWLTVKREGDQNSVKASNEDAREKITKRLEIAEIFYELFSQVSTNTTGEEMNLNKVEKEVIQNAISCKNELLVVKENDNGEEDEYAISKSVHAIFKKIDDIMQKKMSESSHKHHEDESHSHGDDSSHSKVYIDNHYSVQNTVAKRLELAGYQKEFDGLNKVGTSKRISGSSRG